MSQVKIINDPVHGFISLPYHITSSIIDHPYFQRLRMIKQLGLTHLAYPGALHTRFHHALGAFHLMTNAIETLRQKGIVISDDEKHSAENAILLHDIGHGPFSHALEQTLVSDVTHEKISSMLIDQLNEDQNGHLDKAIEIFDSKTNASKKFLHELVSSQLDLDRLDYLARDSFYTGVSEGVIGVERIIKMINVADGRLTVEHKGIYSVEKFLISRRLMYWQVYLHKTVLAAEQLLVKILERAIYLARRGEELFATPSLQLFLYNNIKSSDFQRNSNVLATFSDLDDHDIMASIKTWCTHSDKILSTLCKNLLKRNLFKTIITDDPIEEDRVMQLKRQVAHLYNITEEETNYLVFNSTITNAAYEPEEGININILFKNGKVKDIAEASDQYNISALSKPVEKHFLCYPRELGVLNLE